MARLGDPKGEQAVAATASSNPAQPISMPGSATPAPTAVAIESGASSPFHPPTPTPQLSLDDYPPVGPLLTNEPSTPAFVTPTPTPTPGPTLPPPSTEHDATPTPTRPAPPLWDHPPVAQDGEWNSPTAAGVNISVEGHDVDYCGSGQSFSLIGFSGAAHGTLSNQSYPGSCQNQPANGYALLITTFDYTPDPGYVGDDFVTFSYDDGFATGNIATITIHVDASVTPTPTPPGTPTPQFTPTPFPLPT